MATKAKAVGKVAAKAKKAGPKLQHPPFLRLTIPAGQAKPAPPLGPQLGQRSINIGLFCKDFNEKTKEFKEGTPIPTLITINPDKTFQLELRTPPVAHFLKLAAGVSKGAMKTGHEVAGKVTLKHVYEIAAIKSKDPCFETVPLQQICKAIIGTAHMVGIEVVRRLDPMDYAEFLEKRRQEVEAQTKALEEKRAAKMLRQ